MSLQTFEKEIDQHAMAMMQEMLQKGQYNHPQKSSIREIASNAVDALNERNIAIAILTGAAQVEDHYMDRTDGVFSDSVFDPSYYDLNWLSRENKVFIQYYNNGTADRDELVIRDFGVGLWGKRLVGYFNLGYSTKRNSKFALGKFGIGAKSALSTGVPYFTVTTRYNGKKTSFNVYVNNIEPITPSLDLNTGKDNPSFEIVGSSRTLTVFYEPTTEKNGIDITLQVKKHHKTAFIDAVKSQLMYFQEIRFQEISHGHITEIPTLAAILYEDDAMVISNNAFHNKPHLLIDKVNYGNIDFTELEMEEKKGGIGVKVKAEEVSVSPSRETVIWNDQTKQAVLDAFNRVVDSASKRIEAELQETDFLRWMRACASTMNGYGGGDIVLKEMSNIVDFQEMKPAFKGNKDVTWKFPFMDFVKFSVVTSVVATKGSKKVKKLERQPVFRSELFGARPIIRRSKAESDARKNKYISTVLYPQGFIELVIPMRQPGETDKYEYMLSGLDLGMAMGTMERHTKGKETTMFYTAMASSPAANMVALREKTYAVADFITHNLATNTELIQDYSTIIVPPEFKATESEDEVDEVVEEVAEEKKLERSLSALERRALTGNTLVFTPRDGLGQRSVTWEDGSVDPVRSLYTLTKVEIAPAMVDKWTSEEIYFCSKDDEEMMHLATMLSTPDRKDLSDVNGKALEWGLQQGFVNSQYPGNAIYELAQCRWFFSQNIKFIMVAKENVKYYRDFKQIRQFFMDVEHNTLTMSSQLVKWNTARLMQPLLSRLRFMQGFRINPELRAQYFLMAGYVTNNYHEVSSNVFGNRSGALEELKQYLDTVGLFQRFVQENPTDADGIAKMAQQLLNPEPGVTINDARAIDMPTYNRFMEMVDMANPVHILLNEVDPLIEDNKMSVELEEEVRSYISHKGADILFNYKPNQ
jgi:hypothetical protein